MACRDSDGNFISADSSMLGEHSQEVIPEEKVCPVHLKHILPFVLT